MTVDLNQRIAGFEGRLHALEDELADLKQLAAQGTEATRPAPVSEPSAVVGPWWTEVAVSEPEPAAEPTPPPPPFRPPREPRFRAPEVDWADLLGAKALAIAGGVVTVFGVVFFFALAVNRGWVGPGLRVTLGAVVSALLFAGGYELRRRFGQTHASLAAVGAGIAGGYATLLFAAARYDLVPDAAALALAGAIATVGALTALAWSAELVAGLGLVGAMAVPALAVADTGLTRVGTAFVVLLLAASGLVGLRRGWTWLLVASAAVSVPQVVLFVADADRGDPAAVALAAAFVGLAAAIGVGRHLGSSRRLEPVGTPFVLGSAVFAAVSSLHLLDHTPRGIALLAAACAYGGTSAFFFRTRRDLSSLLWAAALVLGAAAAGELLSGVGLAAVWSAQGAALAWLASRTGESRLRFGSIGHLALAAAHAVLFEAPPRELFSVTLDPAGGVPALVAVAAGIAALAVYATGKVRLGALVAGAVFAVDAASLGMLDAVQRWSTFDWAEVAVTALWSAVALALVAAGARLGRPNATLCGLVAFGAAVLKALVSDQSLGEPERWSALLAVGAALAAAAFLYQLLAPRLRTLDVLGILLHAAGLGLAGIGLVALLGVDRLDLSLALLAGAYAALAGSIFSRPRQRDHATLLGSVALAVGAVAAEQALDGTLLVFVWASAAAVLALSARPLREPRLLLGSAALVALSLGESLGLAAPREFAAASTDPGSGVPALLLSLTAGLVLARASRTQAPAPDEPRSDGYREIAAALRDLDLRLRVPALWTAGVLGLYALSLSVLELFARLSPGDVEQRFQHGHTAVSACWALVALCLLYTGLTRGSRPLRLGGFVLVGAALAKLFLYDLATLSSITRALSFLAVGALLLLAGFFYQRLTEQLGLREPHVET